MKGRQQYERDRISDVFGIFSDSEAEALKKGVAEVRKKAEVRTWR